MSKISIFNTLIVIEQTYIEEIYKLINYWIFGNVLYKNVNK